MADFEEGGAFPHQEGVLLNTGRNALEYILRSIGDVKGVYLPYYTCEVVLEPLKKLRIPWMFYRINSRFEIEDELNTKEGEYVIANNYFGIKDDYIQSLVERFGDRLIVDCAQALFAKPIPGVKCFYSTRKFVGVADGGIAYLGNVADGKVVVNEVECTINHDSHLYKRKDVGAEAGFAEYQANEIKLDNQPIRLMSGTTKRILDHIDYERVIAIRRENFEYLHSVLYGINYLGIPSLESFVCPMVYPFVTKRDRNLRKEMIDNKIYVAKYWPNVYQLSRYELEFEFSERIVPLPLDQRYGKYEMQRIIDIIKK